MYNILIVYFAWQYPLRTSVKDHLYALKRYSGHRCFYVNVGVRRLPTWLRWIDFDLVVFHNTFLGTRWSLRQFMKAQKKIEGLRSIDAVKVAIPQDDFLQSDVLCDFINQFGIDIVLSAAPESEWPSIYRSVDRSKVEIRQVLTGYLDERTVAWIDRLAETVPHRYIDVGYRARGSTPWLGRHGLLKSEIADRFNKAASGTDLTVDISTRREDTYFGDTWYRFLLRCKYTIGVEGGASILDHDGSIKSKTERYLRDHPRASFEEVEKNCFPDADGSLKLFVISPRHLEACATRTCQILVKGTYNGILEPGKHYIELERDFSNLEEIIKVVREDRLREEMVQRAYNDIVASKKYSYRGFVELVLTTASKKSRMPKDLREPRFLYWYATVTDILSWGLAALYGKILIPTYRVLRDFIQLWYHVGEEG